MEQILETPITTEEVLSAYSGEPGCMCGCNGKYYYRKEVQELGGKIRGYAVDDDDIDEVIAQEILDIVNNQVEFGTVKTEPGDYAYFETESRMYCIYLIPADKR